MDRAAYLLLNRLDQEGPMGVKALAEGMGIDSSTVTRQVAPLVDTGLVKRTSHPEDGRAVVLALSPRGRARLDEVRASRRGLMAAGHRASGPRRGTGDLQRRCWPASTPRSPTGTPAVRRRGD